VKIVAFAGTIVPALWIAFQAIGGELGPRPFTEAIHQSGEWTLRLLLITLAVTPALRLLRLPRLGLARRTLGVGCAAYGLLHICLYILDQHFDLLKVASEIVLRIYLTIGALALTGLTALAATSTDAAVRRLGARRWNALHRCVYAIAPLAAVHFFMQSKLNFYEPTLMAGFLVWLLGYRVLFRLNGEVAPLHLVLLACAAALVTAMGEAAIYMFTTGVDARRVLLAHLDPQMELRPAWWVLLASLAIAAAGWWRYRPARRRLRRRVAGGNAISGTQPVAAVVQRRAV
jgi:sulfoxide reductase heme-binding subunit YedZ